MKQFSYTKINVNISSTKERQSCLDINVSNNIIPPHINTNDTHFPLVSYICVGEALVSTGSGNGLSPARCQAFT